MALPWLIGALVVGIAAKVLSSDSDDDKDSRAERDREERRQEELEHELEQERHRNERKKKQASARENFAARGEKIGADIVQSLRGWIDVKFEKTPAFSVRLTQSGHQTPDSSTSENSKRIRTTMPNGYQKHAVVQEHLELFTKYYAANVVDGANLINTKTAIKEIENNIAALESLRIKINSTKDALAKTI